MRPPRQINARLQPELLKSSLSQSENSAARPERILRIKQVVERTGIPRSSLYVLMKNDPSFPAKRELTKRTVGYREAEIDEWILSRAAINPILRGGNR